MFRPGGRFPVPRANRKMGGDHGMCGDLRDEGGYERNPLPTMMTAEGLNEDRMDFGDFRDQSLRLRQDWEKLAKPFVIIQVWMRGGATRNGQVDDSHTGSPAR